MAQLVIYNKPRHSTITFYRGTHGADWVANPDDAKRYNSMAEVNAETEGSWSTHYEGSGTAWGAIPVDQVELLTNKQDIGLAVVAESKRKDEEFVQAVMDYSGGCDEGKREFLVSIDLGEYVQREVEFTFDVTVTVDGGEEVYDAARRISQVISDQENAYCSDYNTNDY